MGGLRNNWRPIVLYFLAPVLLVPTVTAAGVMLFMTVGADRTNDADSAGVPAETRAAAMLELFACLRRRPGRLRGVRHHRYVPRPDQRR